MKAEEGDWSPAERKAFWMFVRGRMAEHGLRHQQVADTIRVDRSNITRRLQGRTKERPSAWMVEQLALLLELEPAAAQQLFLLAGYREERDLLVHAGGQPPNDQPSTIAPALVAVAGTEPFTRRHLLRNAAAIILGLVLLDALTRTLFTGLIRPWLPRSGTPAASIRPGGVWLSPSNGDTVAGRVHFAARAYPTSPGDPAIAFVNFTVSWEGRAGPWLVACQVLKAARADIYECDWDPAAAGAPAGPLHLSFDVYDRARRPNVNLAPNGIRNVAHQ